MDEVIAGRYRIEAQIGVGGMGMVYRGVDTQTGQLVALKNLNAGMTRPDIIERFRREGEALRELNHPNIVKLLDAVDDGGVYYLIMEYVTGGDLTGLMNQGRLETEHILRLAIDLADALTRAHKLNIIHRDLKPANVLIAEDGTLRLSDFGIAHFSGRERVTDVNSIVGTIDYLAPELLKGEVPDARVDIWAFGVMLYELLSGKRPFAGNTVGQIVQAILTKPTPDLEKSCPDAPIALVDLIYRMLMRDREARINSVRLVGAELEAILNGHVTVRAPRDETDEDTQVVRFDPDALLILTPRAAHNLPAQTTPFVGRESELLELGRLLQDPNMRLITIQAPGGMGKTRLAIACAEAQLRNFEHGVYLVQLAPLSDPAMIVSAIAEATRYPFQQDGRDQKQQLLDYLAEKNLLLVMDNYEHLIDGAALVTEILHSARGVRIIATSRQRLNQSGETVFNLGAMDFPKWETPADALEFAAVKLFLQSAQRIQPGFELTAAELPYVARICQLAQGTPLGILLAASWLSTLSPREIAEEMQRDLDFLENEIADLPERQRSLRSVFNYSWNLLPEAEQQVFMKLSIFRGGFTREAAQEIAGATLRTLMTLINKSLLHREVESGRYGVHELLRQYAEEKLEGSGEAEAVRSLHSRYYMMFTHERETDIKGRAQKSGLTAMEADFENVLTTWNRAISHQDENTLNALLEGVYWFCSFRGRYQTGVDLFQRARECWSMQPAESASLLSEKLHVRFPNQPDNKPTFVWGAEVARRYGDQAELAHCLAAHGKQLAHAELKWDGLAMMRESVKLYESLGDHFYLATALDDLGWGVFLSGGTEERIRIVRRALDIRQRIGDRIGTANALRNLATATWLIDLEETQRRLNEAREIGIELQDRTGTAWSALLLASQKLWKSEFDEASILIDEGRQLAEDLNIAPMKGLAYIMLGWRYGMMGDYHQGIEWADKGISLAGGEDNLDPAIGTFAMYSVSVNAVGLGNFDRAARQHTMLKRMITAFGIQYEELPNVWVADYLVSVPFYVGALAHEGKLVEAVENLSLAVNHPLWVLNWETTWVWLVELQKRLRELLGDQQYDAAWERGKTMDVYALLREMVESI